MKESSPQNRTDMPIVSQQELDQFLHALTHEIRNRLSGIALEAADLAEQAGTQVDASRLQQQVQDCSAFLKKVRELVSLEGGETGKLSLAEAAKKLKERSL